MGNGIGGRVVAITGGARGIGYATAARLIADGMLVAIGDIDEARLKEAAAELGVTCFARLDVTDPDSFAAFLDQVELELGPLDVLINNAGVMPTGWFHEESDQVTRRQVEINVLGVMYGSKQALLRMLPSGGGHVINVASLAGESYVPGLAAYCGTKHAVKAFTETLRREYRGQVDFSCIMPTAVNTELTAGMGKPKLSGLLRNAEPEEIAAAVADVIARPRPQVRVTQIAGLISQLQGLVPRQLMEPLARALNVENVFLRDIDREARRGYLERVEVS